jgi:NNP family nitrate/nitrite transporter-like MFS transporter
MSLRDFRKAGNPPTLLSAFLYFDVSFMVWVILGPLGPFIGEAYRLNPTQKGLLTAIPLLGGSFFRIILGWMTERFGARATGITGLSVSLVPLFLAWQFADSFTGFIAVGVLLGVAGASFAAALPLASGWYPPELQGLAMGIAGAGNSGTLFSTLFAPRIAQAIGWRNVFGIAMVPVAIVLILFILLAKNAPGQRTVKRWSDYASLLKIADAYWFCFIYSLTFGGFVGLASYLSTFFHDQYNLTKVQSGDFTTFVVLFGSFLRPVGGMLADRIGGYRMLVLLLSGAGICLAGVGTLPAPFIALGLLAFGMSMLGMGNGCVFQLVPQRFVGRVGMMTGIVGAAGGLGGFFLPSLLGVVKDRLGSFGIGFAILAALMFSGTLVLLYLKSVWRRTWTAESLVRAGLSVRPTDVSKAHVATA